MIETTRERAPRRVHTFDTPTTTSTTSTRSTTPTTPTTPTTSITPTPSTPSTPSTRSPRSPRSGPSTRATLALPLLSLSLLAACGRDAHAEVPKPLPGGHAFEVEITELDATGSKSQQRYVVVVGEQGCGRLQASSGRQSVQLSACLVRLGEQKQQIDVELVRTEGGERTKIEGRVPFVAGQRAVVGRAEAGGRKLEVALTSA